MTAHRPSPLPNPATTARYQQVKEHIRQRIQDGTWKPGARIASEHELVAELGVSRMTVNRALRELADAGEITRVAGVGTFVAEQKPRSGLLQVASLADEVRARGHVYACQVRLVRQEPASADVAEALDLKPGSPVFHAVCVHFEDGLPIQLEDRFVSPGAAPEFGAQDFTGILPGEYLLQAVPLDEVEHLVEAIRATPEVAEPLALKAGDPCLVLTRRTWCGGTPVTLVRCTHPGARYQLGSRFKVSGPSTFS